MKKKDCWFPFSEGRTLRADIYSRQTTLEAWLGKRQREKSGFRESDQNSSSRSKAKVNLRFGCPPFGEVAEFRRLLTSATPTTTTILSGSPPVDGSTSNQRNTTPRRNVSNSSSDSCLISYSDSDVSLTPPKHDVFFPSPSIEFPPPPQHSRMQEPQSFPSWVPSRPHEVNDVPMMQYTESTPITTQFARPPPPRLPLGSTPFPLPSPPTTAKTDAFFSLPLPSTHTPPLSYSPTDSSPERVWEFGSDCERWIDFDDGYDRGF